MKNRSSLNLASFTMCLLAALLVLAPAGAHAQLAGNQACASEDVFYNPGNGEDIIVPDGYKVEVFAKNLNFPTGIAFQGTKASSFKVFVIESGTGLPGKCNNNELFGGKLDPHNPFTPDILEFDNHGNLLGSFGKPTADGGGFQPDGPAIGLAFENGFHGGRLFGSDSNQGARGAPGLGNNTSRIVMVDLKSRQIEPFITGLPTGDHPTEQVLVQGNYIYWSQGSATNSGVTGLDNGAGGNQHDIACQDITLSQNVFDSGGGQFTSGYTRFGVTRPGAVVRAFEGATQPGMCTGAILRAKISSKKVEPVSWGYRNPFGFRFPPSNHPLEGCILVTENGEDERGARPTNNAPDRLACARMNDDGSPDYHGWPDRFGFLDSTQTMFNPLGIGGDNPAATGGKPVQPVLAGFPQPPVAPLALEPADVAVVGVDFAPKPFVHGIVRSGAALVAREGDFGFSPANGKPEAGHDIELVNFRDRPLGVEQSRFAFNCAQGDQFVVPGQPPLCLGDSDQAFVANLRGINRPISAMFGPDGALYLVDYGAVRDGGNSEPGSKFVDPANAPLVQIPGTGVIWKISRTD